MTDTNGREIHVVENKLANEPEIGRWLWAIQDGRRRTMEVLSGLSQSTLDWLPPGGESSIGTVLYHLAVIEVDWLYAEVLGEPFPPKVDALFPYDHRDELGHLTQVLGVSLEQHLARLESVRQMLLEVFQPMEIAEFRRVRRLERYDVTPEWVLHHLIQHEAEHRSQIGGLRAMAEQAHG